MTPAGETGIGRFSVVGRTPVMVGRVDEHAEALRTLVALGHEVA